MQHSISSRHIACAQLKSIRVDILSHSALVFYRSREPQSFPARELYSVVGRVKFYHVALAYNAEFLTFYVKRTADYHISALFGEEGIVGVFVKYMSVNCKIIIRPLSPRYVSMPTDGGKTRNAEVRKSKARFPCSALRIN